MSWKIKFHMMLTGLTLTALVYLDQRGEALEPKVRIAQADRSNVVTSSPSTARPAEPYFLGVQSCAAGPCHGGDSPYSLKNFEPGSEYNTWVQKDPHAQAFSVLKNPLSLQMAEKLRLEKPAHESPLCLNCHAPQQNSSLSDASQVNHQLLEGVSCESCHGNAEEWVILHRRSGWQAKKKELGPDKMYEMYGFRDTKNPWTRAQVCATCHVGSAGGKDVNHDLYAAGHPRLYFELSAFNANLPAHWDRNKDRQRENTNAGPEIQSSFEAKLWAVGQVAGVEAAVDLAVYRANRSKSAFTIGEHYPAGATIPAWPEFAESGCFACHHELKAPSWRQSRGYSNRAPGGFPWQSWLTPFVDDALKISTVNQAPSVTNEIAEFTKLMSHPRPNRDAVIKSGNALKASLASLGLAIASSENRISRDQIKNALTHILSKPERTRLVNENWDSATQMYLTIVVLQESLRDADGQHGESPDKTTTEALKSLQKQLEFMKAWNSPKDYSPFDKDKVHLKILSDLETISSQLK